MIEAVNGWLNYAQRNYTQRTVQHYTMVVKRFYQFTPGCVSDITSNHIEQYIDSVLKNNKRRTGNAHLTAIKSFCRWFANQFCYNNPAISVPFLTEAPPKQRILTMDEYETILTLADSGQRDIIRFLANTALRISEFRSLTCQNISHNFLYLKVVGKARKFRIIPLNPVCQRILRKNQTGNSQLKFVTRYQGRNSIYQMLSRYAVKAGIEKFGPHSLRHFCLTQLYIKGAPLHLISKLAGHADTKTTEKIYVHLFEPRDLLGLTDCLKF